VGEKRVGRPRMNTFLSGLFTICVSPDCKQSGQDRSHSPCGPLCRSSSTARLQSLHCVSRSLSHGHLPTLLMCDFLGNQLDNKQLPNRTSCLKVLMAPLALGKSNESCPARPTPCVLLTVYGLTFDPQSLYAPGQHLMTLELYFHFKRRNSKASFYACGP
jgi:hypothetical protein